MTLGLTMIVKNESDVLERVLDAMKGVADEIVVVDTGSDDGTAEIARRFTDGVYSFEWCDDFSAARNFALSKSTADYWIWLDADDIVPPATLKRIARFKKAPGDADVVMMPYVASTDERGKPTFSYCRERIMRRGAQLIWRGRVHEAVAPTGKVVYLNAPIVHAKPTGRSAGTRNLDIYRSMRQRGERFEPRELYYFARELYYNGYYKDAAENFERFSATDGYAVNKADACLLLSRCKKQLGDNDGAVRSALGAMLYGPPSAEVCCELGGLFFDMSDYRTAVYWYSRALGASRDIKNGAFVNTEYGGFVPLVWLAVCYDRIGDVKKAFSYHLRAQKIHPDNPAVAANREYFSNLGFVEPK